MSTEERLSIVLESIDEERRLELIVILSRLSGKSFEEITPRLDRLPWRLASSLPADKARKLADRLQAEGAKVRLAPVEAPPVDRDAASPPSAASGTGTPPPDDTAGGPPPQPPRPLGLLRRLRWTLRIAFGTKLTQIGLVLVSLLGTLVASLIDGLVVGGGMGPGMAMPVASMHADPAAMLAKLLSPAFLLAAGIQMLGMMLFWGLYTGALMRLAPDYFRHGRRPPFRALLRHALARVPDLLSTVAILFLPVLLLPLGALLLADPSQPQQMALASTGGMLLAVGVGLALFLVLPVAVNERLGPWQAIARGWRLAAGYRLSFFGALVVLVLLMLLTMGVAAAVLTAAGALFAHFGPRLAVGVVTLGYIGELLLMLFLSSAFSVLPTVFYLEARARKEGTRFDWDLLPADDWPRGEETLAAQGRGWRAWGEFLLVNAVVLGLLYLAAPRLQARLGEIARQLQAALPQASQSSGSSHGSLPGSPMPGTRQGGQMPGSQGQSSAGTAGLRPGQPVYGAGAGGARGKGKGPAGSATEAALPKDPADAAYALYQAGRYRASIQRLDQLLQKEPGNAWAWYTRAWAHWKLGEQDQAYADVAKACDLGYQDACKMKK